MLLTQAKYLLSGLFPPVIVLACVFLSACNQRQAKTDEIERGIIKTPDTAEIPISVRAELARLEKPDNKPVVKVKFPELSLLIHDLAVIEKKTHKENNDTLSLYVEPGGTIEKHNMLVTSGELTDITVEQRYETSVTVMAEGPHCDLTDWKHYNSDWIKLTSNEGVFLGHSYDQKVFGKFPEVDLEELKQKVKEHCGEEWARKIRNLKSPHEYPCEVGLSRYFLRITGKRIDTGQPVTKIVAIEVPMGC